MIMQFFERTAPSVSVRSMATLLTKTEMIPMSAACRP